MSSVLLNVRVMNANLSAEIRRLSSAEKIQLVEEIWDQVAEAAQALPVPKAHQAELDRRLATTDGEIGHPVKKGGLAIALKRCADLDSGRTKALSREEFLRGLDR